MVSPPEDQENKLNTSENDVASGISGEENLEAEAMHSSWKSEGERVEDNGRQQENDQLERNKDSNNHESEHAIWNKKSADNGVNENDIENSRPLPEEEKALGDNSGEEEKLKK
jgi:hypothetical protein